MGRVEVITGPMFSGKSEELMRRIRRGTIAGNTVLIFKSILDDRYHGIKNVSSHDGRKVEAVPIDNPNDIYDYSPFEYDIIAIDEVQFLDKEVVDVVNSLAHAGVRVIVSGTDMDFKGDPFGPIPYLMAIAERVDKLTAVCLSCGNEATRNQRLVNGEPASKNDPIIKIGGVDTYEARCRNCHIVK